MSAWSISLAATPRDDFAGVLDEHRETNGGSLPDAVADMIANEVDALQPGPERIGLSTNGRLGDGESRSCYWALTTS